MEKILITIGRQFGSGGREIGKKLARELEIPYYDKELLAVAAKESGLALDFLQDMDEKHPHSLLYSLCVGRPNLVLGNCNISVERMASKAQREAVLHVASQGSCVIVGRGADYILRNEARLFRVFVSADIDFRIQRVVKRDGISEDEARDRIRSMDKARSAYYNFNTEQKWGAVQNYDLCLNVSRWGTDGSVELILRALWQVYPDLC